MIDMMDNSIFPMLDAKRPNIGEQLYEHFLYDMMTGTITGHVGEITGELNIPDEIHGIEIRTIGTGAFTGCTGITSLKIGNGIAEIETGAFSGCSNIRQLTLPDSLKYIGTAAFMGCTNLNDITIPYGTEHIGEQAFYGCGLSNVKLPDSVQYCAADAF